MKPLIAAFVGAAIFMGLSPAAAGPPVTLFEDPAGDAGLAFQDVAFPPASSEGFDLTGGSIARVKKDLVFTVTHDQMPSDGQPGELFRMLYHFRVDTVEWRFTIKTFDIGKPDVIARSGTDRIGQTYENMVRLEQCVDDTTLPITLVNCNPVEYYEGTWDAETKAITWTIPMLDLEAVTGSIIDASATQTTDPPCQVCWVAHYAERSLIPTTMIDGAIFTAAYTVPKK
ncbi:MAG: hypothetical protein ABR505_06850 [Actinomycetota bacterium]